MDPLGAESKYQIINKDIKVHEWSPKIFSQIRAADDITPEIVI